MTDLFQLNIQIIQNRWPDIAAGLLQCDINQLKANLIEGREQTISVNGLQLSSRHYRQQEAALLASDLAKQTENVHLYGVGMGDVPIHLLQEHQVTQIHVHLINQTVFALLISYTNQTQWLTHPSITLNICPTSQFPLEPYIANPAELSLCECNGEYSLIRDIIIDELNREYANDNVAKRVAQFNDRIQNNHVFLDIDQDISALKSIAKNKEAFVIGAGPSLEEHYSFLASISKQPLHHRPIIIAVDAAAKGLLAHGVKLDIVVTIDEMIDSHIVGTHTDSSTALVYFPKADPELLNNWPGARYWSLSNNDCYKLLHHYNHTQLFTNGSVIHPATDLAVKLNCQHITFFGADFGYPNQKSHAYWQDGALGGLKAAQSRHWVLDGHGEKLATALSFRSYLRSLELYIANHPEVYFYRASQQGAYIQGSQFKEPSL